MDEAIIVNEHKTLLVIAHAPSANTEQMLQAVLSGANHPDIDGVNVQFIAPLDVKAEDIKLAHGLIIGTTENLAYMAGLIKDVFDRCYYDCLDHTQGLPFTFYIRAGNDGTGTRRAISSITTGLRWKLVQEPLVCRGEFSADFVTQCEELGMAMSAGLEAGVF